MSVTLPAGVSPRSRWPEVMDLPSLEAAHHAQALRGLGRVHAVTGTVGQAARPLVRLQRRLGRALRVVDLACGRGDIARALERRLRREQTDAVVDGVDLSATAVGLAQAACGRADAFAVCDVVAGELPSGYDAAVNTVFLHHLSE
ncbi:MAG: methyltransferase domain-containing protein, partial [Planctomycetota bacterium]